MPSAPLYIRTLWRYTNAVNIITTTYLHTYILTYIHTYLLTYLLTMGYLAPLNSVLCRSQHINYMTVLYHPQLSSSCSVR